MDRLLPQNFKEKFTSFGITDIPQHWEIEECTSQIVVTLIWDARSAARQIVKTPSKKAKNTRKQLKAGKPTRIKQEGETEFHFEAGDPKPTLWRELRTLGPRPKFDKSINEVMPKEKMDCLLNSYVRTLERDMVNLDDISYYKRRYTYRMIKLNNWLTRKKQLMASFEGKCEAWKKANSISTVLLDSSTPSSITSTAPSSTSTGTTKTSTSNVSDSTITTKSFEEPSKTPAVNPKSLAAATKSSTSTVNSTKSTSKSAPLTTKTPKNTKKTSLIKPTKNVSNNIYLVGTAAKATKRPLNETPPNTSHKKPKVNTEVSTPNIASLFEENEVGDAPLLNHTSKTSGSSQSCLAGVILGNSHILPKSVSSCSSYVTNKISKNDSVTAFDPSRPSSNLITSQASTQMPGMLGTIKQERLDDVSESITHSIEQKDQSKNKSKEAPSTETDSQGKGCSMLSRTVKVEDQEENLNPAKQWSAVTERSSALSIKLEDEEGIIFMGIDRSKCLSSKMLKEETDGF